MNGLATFFTGLRIIGEVSRWSEKALADGVVTLKEAVDLANRIGSVLGVRLELQIPGVSLVTEPEELEETKSDPDKEYKSWEPKPPD